MMMTPYICVCIFALIASFFLIFKHLVFIIFFFLYLYLTVISCRLYKLIVDNDRPPVPQDVRRYDQPSSESPPSIIPTIFRPRTPRNERHTPARNNNGAGGNANGNNSREAEV
jgi:hypothetical protein